MALIVGEQKYLVHKVILRARSPVFATMLEVQEDTDHELKIDNMDSRIVEAMLSFLYTNQVKNLDDVALKLLEAAERYDITQLKIVCQNALYKTLTVDNAVEILIYADRQKSQTLKQHVMNFICDHMGNVGLSQGFKDLRAYHLLRELLFFACARGHFIILDE